MNEVVLPLWLLSDLFQYEIWWLICTQLKLIWIYLRIETIFDLVCTNQNYFYFSSMPLENMTIKNQRVMIIEFFLVHKEIFSTRALIKLYSLLTLKNNIYWNWGFYPLIYLSHTSSSSQMKLKLILTHLFLLLISQNLYKVCLNAVITCYYNRNLKHVYLLLQ